MPTSPRLADDAALRRTALVILGLGFVARLALAALLDPGLDEAYAIAVAVPAQLSWFDHPPMAFWWVGAMRTLGAPLFGDPAPAVWLRLPFVLAFTGTAWLMFDLTRRLYGARAGVWALGALTLAPFFLVSAGSWLVPDGPLVLFLAATARLLVEIVFFAPTRARRTALWLAAGVTLGLAGLSKYHAALFAVGAFVWLLATRRRRLLAEPGPWLAALVAGAVVSPVLVWNAENGWVSFLFQAGRGGGGRTNWAGFGRAILGQAAYLMPWTLVAAGVGAARALRADRDIAAPSGLLLALAVLPIGLFTAVPLLGGDSLPHWQMPGWLFLMPLLGRGLAEAESLGDRLPRLARRFAAATVVLLVIAASLFAALRFTPPPRELVERAKLGRFLEESTTWRGLADGLARRGFLAPDAAGRAPVVVSFRWLEAARLAEALGGRARVTVFDGDPRGFAFQLDPAELVGRDLVLVGRPETLARGLGAVTPYFAAIEPQPTLAVGAGEPPPFDLAVAVGRTLLRPYPLPYPKRDAGGGTR